MSEEKNTDPQEATPEAAAKYFEDRKPIEEYYKSLIEAHKYEAAYIKLNADMSEDELRGKMAIMRMAQMDAQLQQTKEGKVQEEKRPLKKEQV